MGSSSIKEAIVDDHEELQEYYDKYMAATEPQEQQKWSNQYCWELARHTVAEELILYPAFEKYLGAEGKRLADEEREEHQTQKELQYKMEQTKITDPEYKTLFQKLQKDLAEHVIGEEDTIDKLQAKIDKDESITLADSLERTKLFVPTRAHPGIANQPPFETLEAFLLAPIDKLKDMFATFPSKEEK